MKVIITTVTTLLATLSFCASVYAQSGSGGVFAIHNKTDNNVVVGFYTNDGSGWSANWLSDQLTPGTTASAEFIADTGNCEQELQVGWLGADGGEVMDDPIAINICEASNVYLEDNDIYFD